MSHFARKVDLEYETPPRSEAGCMSRDSGFDVDRRWGADTSERPLRDPLYPSVGAQMGSGESTPLPWQCPHVLAGGQEPFLGSYPESEIGSCALLVREETLSPGGQIAFPVRTLVALISTVFAYLRRQRRGSFFLRELAG